MESVELDETLFGKINEGDTIYCNFESSDIWLNLHVNIQSQVKSIVA